MKKKILSIALVLAGLMGTTVMAQTPANTQQNTEQTATRPTAKDRINPFEGLNLSEKQQSEIKALQESKKAERQKMAENKKAEKKDMKEMRYKKAKEYLAKIKNILTPEQYVQFLENAYVSQNGRHFKGNKDNRYAMRNGKHANHRKTHGQRGSRVQSSSTPTQTTVNAL